jgi:hypothetical protein
MLDHRGRNCLSEEERRLHVGGSEAYALLADHTERSWGYGFWGDLGDSSTAQTSVPVTVTSITAASAIGAGPTTGFANCRHRGPVV